ncbi:uncharacterized protein DFL_007905 [Arthrobotrys flagrans]|uniref:Uncharacterized protein n=1 Tax=Arthrobotrys flagrans TaxID=97331 RepID=A0A436ZXA0_ARTFL|nr:hypothetical protein DFL_007905 [Arthrobotrys flagrans]
MYNYYEMKYLITFAGLATVASAVVITSVNPKCDFDYCLRNIIATNLPTRSGFADCTSYLRTTIIPPSVTTTETEHTLFTSTADTTTITITENFSAPPPVVTQKKRAIEYFQPNKKGLKKIKKIKRDEEPASTTITNTPPDYIVKSCTQLGTRLATDRYVSACSCVGVTAGEPLILASGTTTVTETLPSPGTTAIETPTETETAYKLKASISGPASANGGKFLASSSYPAVTGTLVAPTASPIANAPEIIIGPNGKTTIDGKLLVARQSGASAPGSENASFLELITDPGTGSIPTNNFPVSCSINPDSSISCKSPSTTDGPLDRTRLFLSLTGGSSLTFRILKEGATIPVGYIEDFQVIAVALS